MKFLDHFRDNSVQKRYVYFLDRFRENSVFQRILFLTIQSQLFLIDTKGLLDAKLQHATRSHRTTTQYRYRTLIHHRIIIVVQNRYRTGTMHENFLTSIRNYKKKRKPQSEFRDNEK